MIIKEASKQDTIKILFEDEIFQRISDDTCPPKEEILGMYEAHEDLSNNLGAYIDGEIVGLIMVDYDTDKMHFMVLKKFRKLASEILVRFLDVLNQSMWCEIPTAYRSVINFAKKHGFRESGIAKNKFIKNGIEYEKIKLEYEV